jgi:hypothetical protein
VSTLPVEPAWQLPAHPEEQRWLITGLWSEQAVGIVGGEPKCCKSFLALDLAVAVASGTPCLRHFPVPHPGRVLLYAAEDALHVNGSKESAPPPAAHSPIWIYRSSPPQHYGWTYRPMLEPWSARSRSCNRVC